MKKSRSGAAKAGWARMAAQRSGVSRGFRVLVTGDCKLCAPELAEFLQEDGPVDLAILDFPWLTLPRGRRFVQEHIRPKALLVCHHAALRAADWRSGFR